jgi:hypothetical protein
MGTLKPGATYIYEKADGVTYAREFGADPMDRFPIGWDYVPDGSSPSVNNVSTVFGVPVKDIAIWIEMDREAKLNPALHEAIERAKLIYHLSKENAE